MRLSRIAKALAPPGSSDIMRFGWHQILLMTAPAMLEEISNSDLAILLLHAPASYSVHHNEHTAIDIRSLMAKSFLWSI